MIPWSILTMSICRAKLKKQSKRPGQECGNNAKYTHMNVPLCGTHMRPYRKLQNGTGGMSGLSRQVNVNGTVNHVINSTIFPNQAKASQEIMDHFKAGRHAVFLAAEMQVGKTGTCKDTIVRFNQEFADSVASIVLTINDNDLCKQMQREFGAYVAPNYIFKATDLSSKLYIKTLLAQHIDKKILIIIDESHYGCARDGALDKFFRNGEIGLDGCNLPDNVYLLTVSATGNAEVVLTGDTDINQYKRVVVLENGAGYYGIRNMLEDGSLRDGWKLEGRDISHPSWIKLKDLIKKYCTGTPTYKMIRVNDSNGIKTLRAIIAEDSHVRFVSYDQHSCVNDINAIVREAPAYHTVIALAQKIKASKQLDTTHINMMFEYTDGKVSTTVQGLPGRRSGYGKSGHNVVIYSNRKHCTIYNSWAINGFQPSGTPSDNYVVNGVCGRASEAWTKNIPLKLDVNGLDLTSSNCGYLLGQLRPLISEQYPYIYAEYSNPLSGAGILLITRTSEASVKKQWWDNIVAAATAGRTVLGYPRTISSVTAIKGFCLFVNKMTNQVMLTYTKKGKPAASPVVKSTCAYLPQ